MEYGAPSSEIVCSVLPSPSARNSSISIMGYDCELRSVDCGACIMVQLHYGQQRRRQQSSRHKICDDHKEVNVSAARSMDDAQGEHAHQLLSER